MLGADEAVVRKAPLVGLYYGAIRCKAPRMIDRPKAKESPVFAVLKTYTVAIDFIRDCSGHCFGHSGLRPCGAKRHHVDQERPPDLHVDLRIYGESWWGKVMYSPKDD